MSLYTKRERIENALRQVEWYSQKADEAIQLAMYAYLLLVIEFLNDE